ncbi:hypothetical protein [Hydrogenimonas urashimensis]|uniref:hypothetical protein n=1 Tax=Hydrogenimonas urashimensis TaxID=2740515 RepID=UPI0019166F87|nr:hypothetical protein [Hydrogenimonas urashimensis]
MKKIKEYEHMKMDWYIAEPDDPIYKEGLQSGGMIQCGKPKKRKRKSVPSGSDSFTPKKTKEVRQKS